MCVFEFFELHKKVKLKFLYFKDFSDLFRSNISRRDFD